MAGFDPNKFVEERGPTWRELETMLERVEPGSLVGLGVEGARKFGKLYRGVSNDLVRARTEVVDATIVDHLNDLVARAYAVSYAKERRETSGMLRFFVRGYPALVREEWKAVTAAGSLLALGAILGAVAMVVDPDARGVLVPEPHSEMTPEERISEDEGSTHDGDDATGFSAFLFTHNIQVTFLAFGLGITAGLGTAIVLFSNGVPLGALAVQYHQAGQGLFFWAWILPHGIPELTSIAIAGAAGLVLGRGIVLPGRRRIRDALRHEARRAVRLVVGTMPVLVSAGLIEGTISQMHAPLMPYFAKLAFALIFGAALYLWLARAGTKEDAALGLDGRPTS